MYKCDFNDYVECERKKCTECGWNPEVAKARLDAIIEKMIEDSKEKQK
jgi:hypothetical protein